ncbi:hypothetical protein GLOIN_2v1702842 [Rhizophagus irregularis DAOM 181602=DAOM 197198]|uniref:Uncharacterized protein n=1 Tax=Rhizophagus irregularis (strain DAOM 181602 / DAOM 197198 / MUCL 43194) TaxID=747089 RepID=A0A2P4P8B1_RHIID|nr:hypothetical protein GLOIN_2v1702842 [Rhizophagus irregularis DAOM 181602=DAOM 197198]POG61626.1 hypothetical protein GLOIN_2v1702842 [Rhizophagus irregularis DAOM 181602=DAOM 197198]|eukprot:XP_025168492.1 hypothetical protein GLOIN_2v1702842 [Rhizophagus irregularis DAOM 181602=DAOM 197198]
MPVFIQQKQSTSIQHWRYTQYRLTIQHWRLYHINNYIISKSVKKYPLCKRS